MVGINGNKVIAEMIKVRSPHTIIFYEDPHDDYFIHVAQVRTKTGDITDESLIIRPDLETWIRHYNRIGFLFQDKMCNKDSETMVLNRSKRRKNVIT
jgi:hypothetical protein